MAVPTTMDPLAWLRKHLEEDDTTCERDDPCVRRAPDVGRGGRDLQCGLWRGHPDRVNSRNGLRHRDFDTRVGTIDLAIPKLRSGSYYPGWLLEPAGAQSGR